MGKVTKHYFFIAILFVAIFGLAKRSEAAPVISGVNGVIDNGGSVVLSGDGFGIKPQARPFKSSYGNPVSSMNFQETGSFDPNYWTLTGPIMISLQNEVRRTNFREYARLEYSARGNWGLGGYSAGVNAALPPEKDLYIAWWDYYESGFDESHSSTGGEIGYKWIYLSPGESPHSISSVSGTYNRLFMTYEGGVGGNTEEEQNANLETPFGGGFYARPISFIAFTPVVKGEWYFCEYKIKTNSNKGIFDGWAEFKINNKIVFRANELAVLGSSTVGDYFNNIRFGGNYGFDDSGVTQYRYYGDIYIDSEFSRVVLGDNPDFNNCTHLELQIPTEWSNEQITFTANQGTFPSGQAYLFVINKNEEASSGYPVTIGGQGDTTPPASPSGLNVS